MSDMSMPVTWKVVPPQVPTYGTDASGKPTSGRDVTWQASNGTSGTVFVPDAQYTPDGVRAIVNAAVAQEMAISGLTSEG